MKLKLFRRTKEQLQSEFERICDVLSVAVNRGLTEDLFYELVHNNDNDRRSHLWQYQHNQMPSNFDEFDRVDLFPSVNNYWVNVSRHTDTEIIFEINFRYTNYNIAITTDISKVIGWLFNLTKLKEEE